MSRPVSSISNSSFVTHHTAPPDDPDSDTASLHSRHTLHTIAGTPPMGTPLEEDQHLLNGGGSPLSPDPWSGLQSRSGAARASTTTDAERNDEQALAIARARRQTIYKACGKLAALFLLCALVLFVTLWLALPQVDDADRPALRIPKNFEQLQALNTVLQRYKNENYWRVMLCWTAIYIFLQSFSVPGSMYMSILAGAMWGVYLALPIVCVAVATGATICYIISAQLGDVLLAIPSWQARVDTWKARIAEHDGDLLSYLIVIRMMPLPPHNVVNILAPHLGIRIPVFWLSTCLGIFAVSSIHVTIGQGLDEMTSPADFKLFSLHNILLLGGICLAVLIPVAVKRFSRAQPLEGADEDVPVSRPVRLTGEETSLFARARRGLVGRSRADADGSDEDDDELPGVGRIRINGHAHLDGDSDADSDEAGRTAWRSAAEEAARERRRRAAEAGAGTDRLNDADDFYVGAEEEGLLFDDRTEHSFAPTGKAARVLGSRDPRRPAARSNGRAGAGGGYGEEEQTNSLVEKASRGVGQLWKKATGARS